MARLHDAGREEMRRKEFLPFPDHALLGGLPQPIATLKSHRRQLLILESDTMGLDRAGSERDLITD